MLPYSGNESTELEGVGQGSGSGPAIWMIYSVTLLAAFEKFSPVIHLVSPFNMSIMVHILAIFYVNDGMPGVNKALEKDALPLPTLLARNETASQAWERLLFASGGALELSKCFAYVIYWDLSHGNHRIISPTEIPGCITTTPHGLGIGPVSLTYGTSTSLNILITESPWVGQRTLGD